MPLLSCLQVVSATRVALQAEFYSCAATGQPLSSSLRGNGPASTGCQKAVLSEEAQVTFAKTV